ncbi:hypothetical protein [Anaerobutyricum hallii]|uniref:hypothetical protein n=1 Tax=Anaerobutyricum hallii TaxID=39488 RepID=UPI002432E16B|nr:hypothetical protein [Anaerobutyricum hallii]
MEFNNVFSNVGKTMVNSEAYELLKKQYKAKGYNDRKARFAAMGCMSGRSQGSTCKWYRTKGVVYFERTL